MAEMESRLASDQEREAAKRATARAIVRWTIVKATERAEAVGRFADGQPILDAEDLMMFWCEVAPEVPMLLLKAGAAAYMEVEPVLSICPECQELTHDADCSIGLAGPASEREPMRKVDNIPAGHYAEDGGTEPELDGGVMKRTALKPGQPLKRSPMRPRVRRPIRQRSNKMVKLYREVRGPMVAEILAEQPWCQRCTFRQQEFGIGAGPIAGQRSTVVHEKLTRARGGSITDKANCVALCGPCHDEIHLNPRQATDDGWLVSGKRKIGA